MALDPSQRQVAALIMRLAQQRGIPQNRARELVAASYAESTLNPGAVNPKSGAAGLFQLLSPGYRTRAQQLGGLTDPRANTLAIIGDYQRYWQQHPNAVPGAAARDVERSGEGAAFYAQPLGIIGNPPSVPAPVPQRPAVGPPSPQPSPQARAALLSYFAKRGRSSDPWARRALAAVSAPQKTAPSLPTQGGKPQPAVDSPTPPSTIGGALVQAAASQIGQPYVWGGESRKEGGFDCSGLVDSALRAAGINLPYRLTTRTALRLGKSVKGQPLKPGDMIITRNGEHMGLYAGDGRVIVAPHTGAKVQYETVAALGPITDVRRI